MPLTTAPHLLVVACLAAVSPFANAADLSGDLGTVAYEGGALPPGQSALTATVQVMLDRAGVSPGVIDGYPGENVASAIRDFEEMSGLEADGVMDEEVWAALGSAASLTTAYTITKGDLAGLVPDLTHDYADFVKRDKLGFRTIEELVAEKYHMDEDFLRALNPEATWLAGTSLTVIDPGPDLEEQVAAISADKGRQRMLAYDESGRLIAAYPVTIGSGDMPSPEGAFEVTAIAMNPTYAYNPQLNFQQGDNTEAMTLPPGPNGPVGTVWIDLDKETYGIHGSFDPHLVGKEQSHGCMRLTNWDAEELAGMVRVGVKVTITE